MNNMKKIYRITVAERGSEAEPIIRDQLIAGHTRVEDIGETLFDMIRTINGSKTITDK